MPSLHLDDTSIPYDKMHATLGYIVMILLLVKMTEAGCKLFFVYMLMCNNFLLQMYSQNACLSYREFFFKYFISNISS